MPVAMSQPAAPAARGPGRPAGLSRAGIVEAALQILRESGVAGLTMRELSSRLGVALGATYKHVPNKHDLLKLVVAELEQQMTVDESITDGFARTKAYLLRIRAVFGEYPGLAGYVGQHLQELGSEEVIRGIVSSLQAAGLARSAAERTAATILYFALGHLLSPVLPGLETELEAAYSDGLDLLLDGARARIATG